MECNDQLKLCFAPSSDNRRHRVAVTHKVQWVVRVMTGKLNSALNESAWHYKWRQLYVKATQFNIHVSTMNKWWVPYEKGWTHWPLSPSSAALFSSVERFDVLSFVQSHFLLCIFLFSYCLKRSDKPTARYLLKYQMAETTQSADRWVFCRKNTRHFFSRADTDERRGSTCTCLVAWYIWLHSLFVK